MPLDRPPDILGSRAGQRFGTVPDSPGLMRQG